MDWLSLTSDVLAKKREEESAEEEVSDDSEEVEEQLGPLESAAVAYAFEVASTQLFIIHFGTCSTSPDRSNVIARQKVMEVIDETRKEILEKGTFKVLCEKVREEIEAKREEKRLIKALMKNELRIEELKSSLKGQEYARMRDMNEKQEIIASLKDTIHEEITKNEAKLQYIERWEAARQGQHRMRCQNGELELERKLEEITIKCNNEIRVHHEICTFLTLEEKGLLADLQKWKEKYEMDMKKLTEKIKKLEVKRKEQEILRHNLTELYEERQREINAYLDLKEKLRKEIELHRFRNEKATKIQAWWRGTMVRRGLGVFKKMKKLVKDKKKKK